jgi:hypothetical protein
MEKEKGTSVKLEKGTYDRIKEMSQGKSITQVIYQMTLDRYEIFLEGRGAMLHEIIKKDSGGGQ